MVKDVLKEKETIAYLSLKNDLNRGRVAHSYLFHGEFSPLKKEAAFLLAQSIIENKNDFACETCNTCRRIKEGKYFDVIYVDGYSGLIKLENIKYIMDEFSKTSLENANKKVYILDNVNNVSIKAINMLLKFMEEPRNSDTYGILISDDIDNLLETVVSRCEKVPFVTRDFSYLIKEYENKGFDYIDAYLLSEIKHKFEDIDANDEIYLNAKEYAYKTIDTLDDLDYLPILYAKEFYNCVAKDNFKECSDYYLDIMIKMLEDNMENFVSEDDEYNTYLAKLKKADVLKLTQCFLDGKSKLNSNGLSLNRTLLFDQIAFSIIS